MLKKKAGNGNMFCKCCGQELVLGYIQSRARVTWCEDSKSAITTPKRFRKNVTLPYEASIFQNAIAAYHRPYWKTLIVPYGDEHFSQD